MAANNESEKLIEAIEHAMAIGRGEIGPTIMYDFEEDACYTYPKRLSMLNEHLGRIRALATMVVNSASQLSVEEGRANVCATCGVPITNYCPKCERMWAS